MTTRNLTPRILTIDDNPAIHSDFKKILVASSNSEELENAALAFFGGDELDSGGSSLDIELDSAFQGEEGYQMVLDAVNEGRPYTLAFCDMRMPPGWDGLTTIENLWKADPKLQVVICSAYTDNTWADISKRLGHSDQLLILKKPFDNAEVLQLAVSLIEKRRLIDEASIKTEELEKTVAERTEHLNQEREASERLLSAIDSLMVQADADGIVQRWNASAAKVFGVSRDDAIGVHFADLPIDWRDEDRGKIREMLQVSQNSSKRTEASFVSEAGSQRIVGLSRYPVFDNEEFAGTLILGTDLTENRILEQQLHNAQKLESVGQLAAGVAHEINTPMQYIGDNLDYASKKFSKLIEYLKLSEELLAAAEKDGFESELVDQIQKVGKKLKLAKLYAQIPEALEDSIDGVSHVSRIIRAMKELSHPGGEEKAAVDVNRAVETTLTVSTNEWKYVSEVEQDLDPNLEMVIGYQGELNQVLLNLIVNSAHAIADRTSDGAEGRGKISIRTRQRGDTARIEIEDTGGGVPESIRDKIFDPFFTTKNVGKGTGQGLAIAHSVIVQKHAGNIDFKVKDGVGTTFVIDLPTGNFAEVPVPMQSEGMN